MIEALILGAVALIGIVLLWAWIADRRKVTFHKLEGEDRGKVGKVAEDGGGQGKSQSKSQRNR